MATITPLPALIERDNFERFATCLRVSAWFWIIGVLVAYATQLDLARVLALELSSVVASELLGATALAFGPGYIGLALSFVIERVSYLTADLHLL